MFAGEAEVVDVRHSSSNAGEKPGALTALVSSPDGRVWAGFKHGRLEAYTSAGRLFWKKVRPTKFGVNIIRRRAP